jgi:chromosome segregation ATPase
VHRESSRAAEERLVNADMGATSELQRVRSSYEVSCKELQELKKECDTIVEAIQNLSKAFIGECFDQCLVDSFSMSP